MSSFFLHGDSKNNYVPLRIHKYVCCIKCEAYRVHAHGRLNDQDFHRAAVAVAAKERAQAGQVDIAFAGDAAKVEFRTFACFFRLRKAQAKIHQGLCLKAQKGLCLEYCLDGCMCTCCCRVHVRVHLILSSASIIIMNCRVRVRGQMLSSSSIFNLHSI